MRVGIMQPYFLPYIGYFQLIAAVDEFIIYDNIKYTKKGWINRNRFLVNGSEALFSIPLKQDSDSLDIVGRQVSAGFDRPKLLNQIAGAYAKAPEFTRVFDLVENVVGCPETNLFRFLLASVHRVCDYLEIGTRIVPSSQVSGDHLMLRAQEKVIALCQSVGGDHYVNPIGGVDLYDRGEFERRGVRLSFLRTGDVSYAQFGHEFVPNLSILDVLMFNHKHQVQAFLKTYSLL